MFKTKRRKELELKEDELWHLKRKIDEMMHWCATDSPEIGFAALYLRSTDVGISGFRQELRKGEYTKENFRERWFNYIQDRVAAVIDKKMERFNLDKVMSNAALNLLKDQFGAPGLYNSKYTSILRDEACKILNEKLKKGL